MCLITQQSTKEQINEDLIVYKLLCELDRYTPELRSSCQGFPYELNKLYKLHVKTINPKVIKSFSGHSYWDDQVRNHYKGLSDLYKVTQGFHSFLTIERAQRSIIDDSSTIYECLIPKGSYIVKDATDLAVSNRIIIVKRYGDRSYIINNP